MTMANTNNNYKMQSYLMIGVLILILIAGIVFAVMYPHYVEQQRQQCTQAGGVYVDHSCRCPEDNKQDCKINNK